MTATHHSPVVLITGASSGIGLATARHFARHPTTLFLVGRDRERLAGIANETRAIAIRADLTQPEDIERVAETVRMEAGHLDVLINCAGQLEVGPTDELNVSAVERLMRVNFFGTVAMIDACLPLLRAAKRGSIVNVGSIGGLIAPPYMTSYAASKFALTGYTRALRQELRPEGIHVGLVLPAPARTPMVDGKLYGPYYRVPPGTPVVKAEDVASTIVRVIERRIAEAIVPRWITPLLALGAAAPRLVDWLYAAMGVIPARDRSR